MIRGNGSSSSAGKKALASQPSCARCCHPRPRAPGSTPRTSDRPIPAQWTTCSSTSFAGMWRDWWRISGPRGRYSDYVSFRQLLPRPSAVFLVDLLLDREARNHRRITRAKQTTQEWRDMVDRIPEDQTIRQAADADYRYIGIDTTDLDVAGTVRRIKGAIPEVYAD